ncbi:ABC transporter permease [Lactococcus allomyrinae]|uniref:ABC transporter permease n=1 Tax=Lactococcus allomyrinae TaxID=2419773 RepID=A0A387BQW9_9LACT|nr:ABC transporter permease [Lactococcus allomyrinae]AYG00881.1 ABC transporter permease [Lactococcus allomyrinae]
MKFFIRRATFYIVTAWAAVTLNFFIPRMMPGDPVQALIARYQGQISVDAVNSLRKLFGMDSHETLWQQYIDYWVKLFHGNLGVSLQAYPTKVSTIIAQSLPWTIGLVGLATIIAFVIGTTIGIILGWRRGTKWDALIPITTFFSSVPYFWIGLMAIAIFATALQWFPQGGSYSIDAMPGLNGAFISSVAYYGFLPALTIVLSSMAGWILGMRNMMVTVSSEDYVTVAHAKGLRESVVMFRYASRNAILPQISGFALSLGFVVSGTLVMEQVFNYQGIGYRLLQATNNHDYPLMQGIFLVITMSVLLANIVADVVYAFLDPRTRKEG